MCLTSCPWILSFPTAYYKLFKEASQPPASIRLLSLGGGGGIIFKESSLFNGQKASICFLNCVKLLFRPWLKQTHTCSRAGNPGTPSPRLRGIHELYILLPGLPFPHVNLLVQMQASRNEHTKAVALTTPVAKNISSTGWGGRRWVRFDTWRNRFTPDCGDEMLRTCPSSMLVNY